MPEQSISGATGTIIGDLVTLNGGNEYDGNTSQAISGGTGPCAFKGGGTGNAYTGKNYGSGKVMSRVQLYGASDAGFENGSNGTVTLTLYGKNSAPANGTDGTSLGSTSFTDTADNTMRTITSTDQVNAYKYVWVYILTSAGTNQCCSEVVMYEIVVSTTNQTISVSSVTSAAALKTIPKLISTTCSTAASLVNMANKFVSTSIVSSISFMRSIGKNVAVSCSTAISIIKAISTSVAVSASTVATVLKTLTLRVVIKKVRVFISEHFGKGRIGSQ